MAKRQGPFWDFVEGRVPGAPASQLLEWKCLDIDPGEGTVTVQYQAKPDFLNPAGVVQGGFVAAMLDDAMAPAVFATLEPGQFSPSLELKVNFIQPAKPGTLIARARVVHRGRSIVFVEGDLKTPEGKLIATATATHSILTTAKKEVDMGQAKRDLVRADSKASA